MSAAPRASLPDDTRLGHVTLAVADLDRSVDYYTRVVGLEVQARANGTGASGAPNASGPPNRADAATSPPRIARLGAAGGGPVLLELREQKGAKPVPRNGRLGLFHFAILVPDRAALGRFLAHVRTRGEPLGMADHLVSEALYLWDPDGLGIEVYVDRPRANWRWQGDEVAMDTLSLDVAGVLAAGGGAPFAGLPMGTTIGHVHLHVGDLGAAERFYGAAGLGFAPTLRRYRGALFLSAGRYHHHLGTNTWAGAAPPAGADEARLLEWELLTTRRADAEAALDRLAASAPGSGNSAGPAAVTRTSDGGTAADPWGTVVRIRSQLGT
jgi:catechol 2,3-dioxygenase